MNFIEKFNLEKTGFDEEKYSEEIREIKIFRDVLNNHFLDQLSDKKVEPEELPENPFKKFEAYLEQYLKERGIEEDPKDYAAIHYVQGSTPQYSRIKGFDLEGDLIRLKFKEFVITKYPELFESN